MRNCPFLYSDYKAFHVKPKTISIKVWEKKCLKNYESGDASKIDEEEKKREEEEQKKMKRQNGEPLLGVECFEAVKIYNTIT